MPDSLEQPPARHTRELAAIMFSDVCDYTLIMGRDEAAGVRARSEHRELLRSILPKFNGRVVDEAGDGTLSSFRSAVDAVNCARHIQASLNNVFQYRVRIGIHVGDILSSGGHVIGDGVNVASRIHALAPPGGICVSERVYDDLRNKPEFGVRDLGRKTLKNVNRPIRVYAVVVDDAVAGVAPRRVLAQWIGLLVGAGLVIAIAVLGWRFYPRRSPALAPSAQVAEQAKATVAVLPFANLSASKDDEFFSDGMTDEIIGDLSKIAGLQVAGRTSSFALKGQNVDAQKAAGLLHVRNLLEGSVRRAANKVRIEVQLTDAQSGFNLWSEKYDEDMSDVFRIQSDVAKRVAESLQVKLLSNERERVERKPTQNLEAYNLYLQGKVYEYSKPLNL